MGRVAKLRSLPLVNCMIATPLSDSIGQIVTIISGITGEQLLCRVTDVVRKRDMPAHMRTLHLVEFDNASGKRMCRVSYAGQRARRDCPIRIVLAR